MMRGGDLRLPDAGTRSQATPRGRDLKQCDPIAVGTQIP